MPATPAANWFSLAFLAMVLVLLAFNKDTVIALYVAPVWVAIMVIGYLRFALSPRPGCPRADGRRQLGFATRVSRPHTKYRTYTNHLR